MPMAGYDQEARRILDQLEQSPRVQFSACNAYTIIAMVEVGLGVSILPALFVENYPSRAVALPFDPPQYRTIGMGVPQIKTASPATRNFMEYLQNDIKRGKRPKTAIGTLHKKEWDILA